MEQTPVPERIEIDDGTEVMITWQDGTESHLAAELLRRLCPCAGCKEGSGHQQLEAIVNGDDPITIEAASLVGAYAINLVFGPDDHGTGIEPWQDLYQLGSS